VDVTFEITQIHASQIRMAHLFFILEDASEMGSVAATTRIAPVRMPSHSVEKMLEIAVLVEFVPVLHINVGTRLHRMFAHAPTRITTRRARHILICRGTYEAYSFLGHDV
jgi:hypothetical protein